MDYVLGDKEVRNEIELWRIEIGGEIDLDNQLVIWMKAKTERKR